MRPIAKRQSALRAPLNDILGAEANVRLLRELVHAGRTGLSQAELARRTSLTISGVGRAVRALEDTGVLALGGTGASRSVALKARHPMSVALSQLFVAEARRAADLRSRLHEVCRLLPGPPVGAWIEGPLARDQDTLEDPVILAILVRLPAEAELVRDALREPIDHLSDDLDVMIEPRILTQADVAALHDRLQYAEPVFGVHPSVLAGPVARGGLTVRTHRDLDDEILARARTIAALIREDPTLLERARRFVADRMEKASVNEQRDLEPWARLLASGDATRIRRWLVAKTQMGTRLRQSMPFPRVLTEQESARISKASSE